MSGLLPLAYTILFIRQGSKLLMLNRDRAPAKGLWNGVGGKLEPGEAPLDGVLREALEETDIRLAHARFRGVVTWESDHSRIGGMYAYVAVLPDGVSYPTPRRTDEGLLEWKEIEWIFSENNLGIGEIIPKYLPALLHDDSLHAHHFVLNNNRCMRYDQFALEHFVDGKGRELGLRFDLSIVPLIY
ncbi:8-oxo-dGTP diphosphatase [Paenibacillus mesophilus]|uniref:NUDIX hydrolase n=1 Tax=Paenibacillus mesophilus TaxID=2582849 RepID=UPI00110EBFC0|nr:8-oxo-dGTP diphosphatase [Paenibacillus mesophilus]TMV51973.1 8-oxo-dGTP diphosphatase [Paenibacillus mesophilus]